MDASLAVSLRGQLLDRRQRIHDVVENVGEARDLVGLLHEVDTALERLDGDAFGLCAVCGESVGEDTLLTHPLIQYCLCDLTAEQQSELQRDLDLAWRVQSALLPKQNERFAGWEVHYRYDPAGAVSGDYCDVVTREGAEDTLHLLLGDVSGKGVAASFLMARLNALLRSLVETDLAVPEVVERVNRILSASTIASHYATLVYARASETGEVEICNAGHFPPLVIRGDTATTLDSTGIPVGILPDTPYQIRRLELSPGDTLFLYSDGLTEAPDPSGDEYGIERLTSVLTANGSAHPALLAQACLQDLAAFQSGAPRSDDRTMMVVRRTG